MKELTINQMVQILEEILEQYGVHHGVRYTQYSLVVAVKLSERYVTDRFLPDKVSGDGYFCVGFSCCSQF